MRQHDLSGLNVLIVDDSRHFLTILRTTLRAFRVQTVFECRDAVSAFEILRQNLVDIAIVDLKLGEIDGLEFTSMVRSASDSQNPRMPIIMVTAFSERSNVDAAISAGVDEFLLKPVSPQSLYKRIIATIDRPRPYLRAKSYFGPDRRRANRPFKGPDKRKVSVELLA